MATRLKHRTVVFVGGGFTAALAARQLTAKGVDVVVLERGIDRTDTAATSLPSQRDELRWDVHGDLFQDWSVQTYTLRHNGGETALPIRRLQAFKPGEGMGGAANHWNGQTWRWAEYDPVLRTQLENRYGKKAIPAEMAIQDWGVTYAEMESYHDLFEKLFGIAGKAGNLRGKVQEGGNPFEAPRQNEYPQTPLPVTEAGVIFSAGNQEASATNLFPMPAANSPAAYTNPDGMQLGQCQFCGHCERFICEANAKASPEVLLYPMLRKRNELRVAYCKCHVLDVDYDRRRQARAGRPLSRSNNRRRIRAAGRHRRACVLHDVEHQVSADGRHRNALRPADRSRRRRQEFLPPDHVGPQRVSSRTAGSIRSSRRGRRRP